MAQTRDKTLPKTTGVPKHSFETKTSPRFPLVLSEHVDVPSGNNTLRYKDSN